MTIPSRSQPTPRRFLLVAAAVPALFAVACGDADDDVIRLGADHPQPSLEDLQNDDAVGSEVDLTFATFDGDTANFTTYAGTPLVINFFARTCSACVSEMPEFEAVFREFGGTVAFVGISTDPRKEDAEILIEETGVTYDLGWDPQGELFARFGGFAMPTTVFVTSDGVVHETWSGVLTGADLMAKIEELA